MPQSRIGFTFAMDNDISAHWPHSAPAAHGNFLGGRREHAAGTGGKKRAKPKAIRQGAPYFHLAKLFKGSKQWLTGVPA
jgi:hypothetical protein